VSLPWRQATRLQRAPERVAATICCCRRFLTTE